MPSVPRYQRWIKWVPGGMAKLYQLPQRSIRPGARPGSGREHARRVEHQAGPTAGSASSALPFCLPRVSVRNRPTPR
eukprot:95293-Chlamydomonas_euryale.AAC.1